MSVKSKVLATAATLTLLGGAGVAAMATAGAANAASPSCGDSCIDVFSHQFGTFADPNFVMDAYKRGDAVGTPVILFRTSNADPAEDFTVSQEGLVSEFYAASLVSAGVALQFGCTTGVFGACDGQGQGNYWAYEFMYSPYGVQTGLCTGLAATAVAGEKVTLQPCGVSGKTVWIAANPTQESATVPCDPATAGSACTPKPCQLGTLNCVAHPFTVSSTGTTTVTETAGGPTVTNGEEVEYTGIPAGSSAAQYYTIKDVVTSGGVTTFELFTSAGVHTEGTATGWTLTPTVGTSKYTGTETNPLAGDQNPLSAFAEPLVNGSDTNFSSPYALTYPGSSYPTDTPRPSLYVTNLLGFSTGALNTNQLWSADAGVLP
jgi:hypothetical protein